MKVIANYDTDLIELYPDNAEGKFMEFKLPKDFNGVVNFLEELFNMIPNTKQIILAFQDEGIIRTTDEWIL